MPSYLTTYLETLPLSVINGLKFLFIFGQIGKKHTVDIDIYLNDH